MDIFATIRDIIYDTLLLADFFFNPFVSILTRHRN